ncbi:MULTISPECIES: alanine--tRNA ligase [Idiomarina]|jgi:alanyl-tRNA synthetase|uniref:Alanine--tRNA ligase n=1 Tax=Idiomarina abyssalis TaxID=86102 RepID=A0A8I1GBC7_9GAMM|nr:MULTISPECIES: alanine--tRNA ligase [Idiomarina]KPD22975.1 alanyl-tRNA synthetase [Idiomarina abyssalis]MAB21093.1 alanine--tRNA ligase [Idiomarina sp.]MAO69309.1 alanine--tRNA ligase [Idiomarina sp.]MBE93010.1 alanine--tRNA ligase [Idiomarina sp.]MBF80617.1 alanine--tRNA ligase [Idiomarina sp.]|tara:strand:- start:335 stop:2932 length:2598 start_codon:yes stop_codon:yes gene_type:complete
MSMNSAQIRDAFLNYFAERGHEKVPSSSMIPGNDPTLLFTNAGMVPFKDVFLGTDKRRYNKATSAQRCLRAGGKHNDLENVGYTARHHTFFEMMGNFSFGDYFKKQAIQYAWDFLTKELKLPAEKLWVTVFTEDDEAYDIWAKDIGVPEDRISRIGEKDNFWSMGDTGPCGPCSEVFYDHGPEVWGGPPGTPEEDGDRYIEIWNLVFMQYNRQADGTFEPLPDPSIDTGMGLERISAIMQNVHSNYEIDLFQALIKAAAEIIGTDDLDNKSLRVIADHIRSCSFLITDGVMPSNEGRGYVLRRIIRRAVRHGHLLGAKDAFFFRLVDELARQMGDAYPELVQKQQIIKDALEREEQQFARTLERGLAILSDEISQLKGKVIPGDVVFKLYDTYGFPVDLTADIAREHELTVDEEGFEQAMSEQRLRAQQASQFGMDYNQQLKSENQTTFTGYDDVAGQAKVVELFKEGQPVEELQAGDKGIVVLSETPFYAESGGQIGDKGVLVASGNAFEVTDTQYIGKAIAHHGVAKAPVKLNDSVKAEIDSERRENIKRNHSATHLLHAALRNLLGEHVTQKGSLVEADKMRFDFSHFEPVTNEQLAQLEREVNAQIRTNLPLQTELMAIDQAKEAGAMALFGEKYDDQVRVVRMGDFSMELCGGTHVKATGDIGLFRITSEGGIASGVRRIEVVTGEAAIRYTQQQQSILQNLAGELKTESNSVAEKVQQLQQKFRELERKNEQLQQKLAQQAGGGLIAQAIDINGVKAIIAELDQADPKSLRGLVDDLKNQIGSGIVLLGTANGNKVSLIAGVTADLTSKVKAGDIVNQAANVVGGKGGGRPDMAQAGGSLPEQLNEALATATTWLQQQL